MRWSRQRRLWSDVYFFFVSSPLGRTRTLPGPVGCPCFIPSFNSTRVKGCCLGIGAASSRFGGLSPPLPSSALSAMTNPPENKERLVELAYRRSIERLQLQAEVANFADQRSLVFATLSIASAALVFGALKETSSENSAIGAAIFFCLAAAVSATAAMPGKVYSAGSKAAEIRHAIDQDIVFASVLLGLCENNDFYIDRNEQTAKTRAHMYRFSILLFLVGVTLSLFGFYSQ